MEEGCGRAWILGIGKLYSAVEALNAHLDWETRRWNETQYSMAHEVSEENKDIIRSWTTVHSGSILVTSLPARGQCPEYTWGVNFLGRGNIKIL